MIIDTAGGRYLGDDFFLPFWEADLIRNTGPEQVLLGSGRPFGMGTDHPVEEVRALGLGPDTDLVLTRNAARLLGADRG